MTKFRKMIALLLSLVMFIGMLPTDALAEIISRDVSQSQQLRAIIAPAAAAHTYVFKNGDAVFAQQIVKDGEELKDPGTPSPDSANKEFVGWYNGEEKAVFGAKTVTDTQTITYTAKYEDVYFVFFTNPKGEVMVTKKGYKGDTITAADVTYPVGNEESITGWQNASGEIVSSVTLDNEDITLTAVVTTGHWITYDSEGGSYVAPTFVKGDENSVAPTAPTRPGYTFDHWSETENGEAFTFGSKLDKSLTLHAVWTANTNTQYTVIHWQENADDTEYSYKESETKTGTTGAMTAATAKSTNTDDYRGFTAQAITQETIAGDGSTIVNVYYTRNVYTITFHLDDPIYNCGKEAHSHGSPSGYNSCYQRTCTGHDWWEHTDDCYTLVCTKEEHTHSNACGTTSELTITAKYGANISDQWPTVNGSSTWRVNSGSGGPYQVNIDTMPLGGTNFYGPRTGSGSQTAYYYVEVLPGETGTVTQNGVSYKLHHSDTSPGSGFRVTQEDKYAITGFTYKEGTANQESYNNARFYYTRNSYNIVYVSNGQTVNTVSKKYQQSIADGGDYTPDRPTTIPETYTFGGWYADPATTQAYTFTDKTMPAQNITVYAKWVAPEFTGTAHKTTIGGDDVAKIENIPYGGTITDQLDALQEEIMKAHPGYTWRGWRTGANGTGDPFNVDTKIYGDITLYPYYTKDGTFGVTYESGKDGVTAPTDSKRYAEDSYADLMSPGTLIAGDGEYFYGWVVKDTTAPIYQPRDKYQIKGDVTFTGVWGSRPADVTLTYKANGGTGNDVTKPYANNETVTAIDNPFTRAGYTFEGWDTNKDATTGSIKAGGTFMVDNNGDNVLYAIWKANTNTKYTVEFYYQNVDGSYSLNHADERFGTTDTTASVTDADKENKENNKYVFDDGNANNVLSGTIVGAGTLVLKLYFKLNTAEYTIHHYLKGTTIKVADDQTGTKTIGETLTADKSTALYTAYANATVDSYDPEENSITIVADKTKNVITVYYTVPLTLTAGNASKTYDGTPLTQSEFTATGLVNGDTQGNITLSMTDASTITNVGTVDNVIDTTSVKYNGGAIPSYYTVSYEDGTLTITKASIAVTFTGESATKTYNGNEQSITGITETGLLAGHTYSGLTYIAKGTNVGEYDGAFSGDVVIQDASGVDVTQNYVVTTTPGVLTITKAPIGDNGTNITLTPQDASKKYDGWELACGTAEATDTNGNTVMIEYSEDGTTWLTMPSTITATDVADSKMIKVRASGANYEGYVYATQQLTITERTVTLTSATDSKEYDGTALTNSTVTVGGDGFVTGEGATYNVTGSQTNAGSSKNTFTYSLNSNTKEDNYTITKTEGTLTVTKSTSRPTLTVTGYNGVYDGLSHSVSGETVTGAVAGTVWTYQYSTDSTDKKTWGAKPSYVDVTANEITVYVKASNANYEDITASATVKITPKQLKVYAEDTRTYSGSKQTLTIAASNVEEGGLVSGETLTLNGAAISGTDVGTYTTLDNSTETNPTPYTWSVTKADNTTDSTKNYTIDVTGKLTITQKTDVITITANSTSKTYDGTTLTDSGYSYTQGILVEGDVLTAVVKGSQTNIGSSDNVVESYKVMRGQTDVTANYKFGTSVKGTLTIAARPVEITVNTASYEYDGTTKTVLDATTGKEYVIEQATQGSNRGLLSGHTETLDVVYGDDKATDGKIYVGEYTTDVARDNDNKPQVTITASGNDVTANYDITVKTGTLTITRDNKIDPVKTETSTTPEGGYKLGDAITYTITVKNVSNETVEGVVVTEPAGNVIYIPDGMTATQCGYTVSTDGLTATIASIPSGGSVVVYAKHTVTSNDILLGGYQNTATVKEPDDKTQTVSADPSQVEEPDSTLTVTKTSDKDGKKVALGETITYTITVTNKGNVPYNSVVVKEQLAGLTITEVNNTEIAQLDSNKFTVDQTNHKVTVTNLAVGETVKITAKYVVTSNDILAGKVSNSVTAGGVTPEPSGDPIPTPTPSGDPTQPPQPTPTPGATAEVPTEDLKTTLTVVKTSKIGNGETGKTKASLGDTIYYTITVTNNGNVTYNNVVVTDALAGLTITGVTDNAGAALDSSRYTTDQTNYKVTFGSLAVGETVKINATYTVTEADILSGKITNVAVAEASPVPDPRPSQTPQVPKDEGKTEDDTDVPVATLSIAKAVISTPTAEPAYKATEKIKYQLTVSVGANNNVTVKNIKVTDTLLTAANVQKGIVAIEGDYTLNNNNEIELPDMAPGASPVVITYTYEVQGSDLGTNGTFGNVHNVATVSGTAGESDDPNDPDDRDPKDPTATAETNTPTRIYLVIKAKNNEVTYDGEAHGYYKSTDPTTDPSYTITQGALATGDSISALTIAGSRTDAGVYERELKPSNARIMNADGSKEVTDNYDIQYVAGNLTINKRPVKITVNTASYEYDGTTKTVLDTTTGKEYVIEQTAQGSNRGLLSGHTETLDVVYGDDKATDGKIYVGEYTTDVARDNDNTPQVTIAASVNDETDDVTANYDIEVVTGKLTITKSKTVLTVTAKSDSKTYDGTALTNGGYTVTYGNETYTVAAGESATLSNGDVVKATISGSVTDVGATATPNEVTAVTITAADGTTDHLGQYETVTKVPGELTITKRKVTLTSGSASKVYDGNALTNSTVTVGGDGFITGEGATYDVTGSQTDVGSSSNTFTYSLNSNTKAGNYDITKTEGTLTVTAKTNVITITANSNSKPYDGTALTDSGYTYTEGILVAGDVLTAVVEGSQTDAGSSDNVVKSYKVMRGQTDVTANYTFGTSINGTLTVNRRTVTLTSATASKVYDGTALTNSTVTEGGDGFVTGEGATYDVTGSQTDAGNSKNTFTYTLNSNTKASNYTISTTEGTLTVTPVTAKVTVTVTEKSDTVTYDGNAHSITGYVSMKADNALYNVSTSVTETPTTAWTATGTNAGTYPVGIVASDFANKNTNFTNVEFVIVDGALTINKAPIGENGTNITLTPQDASKKYDGWEFACGTAEATDTNGNTVRIEYSEDGTTWLTMPSGIMATNVSDSKTIQVRASGANYEGYVYATQQLTITERTVTLTSATDSKEYDGTALKNSTVTVGGDGFVTGEGATYNVTGSQTNAGNSKNTFTYTLQDNTLEENYDITTVEGTLTVTAKTNVITITANSNSKTYDGTALTDSGYSYTQGILVEGDVLTAVVEGSQTDAGTSSNKVTSYKVMRGQTDVTANYTFGTSVDGTLTVNRRTVTLTSATDSKEYDGTALKNSNVTVGGDGFVTGEGATYNVTGSQTNAGNSKNTFTYTLQDNTLAENYDITTVEGTLTVTQRGLPDPDDPDDKSKLVTITAVDNTVMYDGNAHGAKLNGSGAYEANVSYTTTRLVEGHYVSEITISGSKTDANKYEDELVPSGAKILDASGNDVTANYYITYVKGDLEITKRSVTLTSESASKVYDSTPLTKPAVTVSGYGFVDGEVSDIKATGTITNVGSVTNTITYTPSTNFKAGNYDITKTEGTLTITQSTTVLTVTANSDSKTYNGTALTNGGYTVTYGTETHTVAAGGSATLSNGDVVTATISGSVTHVKDTAADNNKVVTVVVKDGAGENASDVTSNYATITTVDGTLTITKRDVTVTSDSESKVYDGTPLYKDTVTVSKDSYSLGFAGYDGLSYSWTGGQTNAGSSENTFGYTPMAGTDLNDYNLTIEYGTLTVTKRPITVSDSLTVEYNGSDQTLTIGTNGTNYKVNNLVTGETLTLAGATITGRAAGTYTTLDGATETNPAPYTWSVAKANNVDSTGNYDITVTGTLTITGRRAAITFVGSNVERVYNGATQTFTTTEVVKDADNATGDSYILVTGLVGNDTVLAGTISHTMAGMNVGEYNGAFAYSGAHSASSKPTIMNGNLDVTDSYTFDENTVGKLTITKRPVVLTVCDNTVEYDGNPHGAKKDSDGKIAMGISYTASGVENNPNSGLVSGHTVTDVEIGANETKAGTYTDRLKMAVSFNYNKLEKPLIKDGSADVTDNYSVTLEHGTLTINQSTKPLVITSAGKTWVYDGEVHTNHVYTVTYDGTAITPAADGKTFTLPTNDVLTITPDASAMVQFVDDNKTANNTFTYTILSAEEVQTSYGGGIHEDRKASYANITTSYGDLAIGQRKIAIKAADHTWEYDGNAHTYPYFNVAEWTQVNQNEPLASEWHLVTGTDTRKEYSVDENVQLTTLDTIVHTMSDVQVEGTITYVGTAPNTPKADTVVIMRGEGTDAKNVTNNYEFVKLYNGTLTITGDPLDPEKTIVKDDPAKKYDIGDKIQFTINVKNTTTQTLTNVTVYDATAEIDLPAGDNFTYGADKHTVIIKSITSGDTIALTAWHTVTEADITQTFYKNEVVTTVEYGNKEWPLKADETTTDLEPPVKSLKITKELVETLENAEPIAEGRTYKSGETAYFKITVENTGNQTVTGITVNEVNTELTGDALFIDGTKEWKISSLAPKTSDTNYAYYVVTEADLANNEKCPKNIVTATTTDDTPTPNPGTEEIPLPEPVKLTIHYLFADGTTAFPDYETILRPGMPYSVLSPVLEGYLFRTPVEGVMPDEDHVEIVRYIPEGGGGGGGEGGDDEEPGEQPRNVTTLLDYPTPLGLSNVFMNVGDCFE